MGVERVVLEIRREIDVGFFVRETLLAEKLHGLYIFWVGVGHHDANAVFLDHLFHQLVDKLGGHPFALPVGVGAEPDDVTIIPRRSPFGDYGSEHKTDDSLIRVLVIIFGDKAILAVGVVEGCYFVLILTPVEHGPKIRLENLFPKVINLGEIVDLHGSNRETLLVVVVPVFAVVTSVFHCATYY